MPHAGRGKIPNRLSALSRFKILDNLRRSQLAQPALLALLLAGWFYLPGSRWCGHSSPWEARRSHCCFSLLIGVWRQLRGIPFRETVPGLRPQLARWILAQGVPGLRIAAYAGCHRHHSGAAHYHPKAHAPVDDVRSLHPLAGARRRREPRCRYGVRSYPALLFTGVLALLIAVPATGVASRRRADPVPVAHIATAIRRPSAGPWVPEPGHRFREMIDKRLRRLARRTWLFFEHFVGPEDHWLPPDHFQEDPTRPGSTSHVPHQYRPVAPFCPDRL